MLDAMNSSLRGGYYIYLRVYIICKILLWLSLKHKDGAATCTSELKGTYYAHFQARTFGLSV